VNKLRKRRKKQRLRDSEKGVDAIPGEGNQQAKKAIRKKRKRNEKKAGETKTKKKRKKAKNARKCLVRNEEGTQ